MAILASIVGALSVRTRSGNVEAALYRGLAVSGVLSAAAFYPITQWLMGDITFKAANLNSAPTVTDLWFCALIGIAVTAGLFVITDYYTSTRFRPVRTIAKASVTGHATNIIQGLAQGFQSTALPAILLALAILGANELAGIYGIGVAVMAQLSLTGLIVALDAFGPITDNAGGHRRDGGPAGGRPQHHRSARRGREHDQGGDQGIRDRLRGARRAGAVQRLPAGAPGRGGGRARAQLRPHVARRS